MLQGEAKEIAMDRSVNGFNVVWAGERVLATREQKPEYLYEFNVSGDWMRITGLYSTSQPDEDERPFEKDAGKAVEEFLRLERG
jgi:hypothetical protein